MGKHSSIGASSATRWFQCPGSIRLIAQAPEQEQSRFAAEGTAAHELAERCLRQSKFPEDFFGEIIKINEMEFEVEQDMVDAVNVYLDEVNSEQGRWMILIEQKIDLSRLYPGLFGTADIIRIDLKEKILQVIDYKHGKGIPVEVEDNKQGMYYALGAIEAVYQIAKANGDTWIQDPVLFGWHQFKSVEIVIVQPRARHVDGPIRRWVVPTGRLDAFQDDLLDAAKATANIDAPLRAGSHCRFCPAIAICPAQLQMISQSACADFTPVVAKKPPVLPPVDALTTEQLVGVLKNADQISSWIKAVEAHAFALLSRGEKVPGFKLVKKKANRKWANEDEAKSMLSLYMTDAEMLTVPELKSPAQVEKSLKKKERELLSPYITVPDTGNTIAEDNDPREEILGGSVMDDFKAIN